MAIDLIDKIKPKNNGKFALVDAVDVEMPDGSRLSDSGVKTFDLVTLGMGAVSMDGTPTVFETVTTEIQAALAKGAVKFIVNIMLGEATVTAEIAVNNMGAGGMYICSCAFELDGLPMIFNMYVSEGMITAYFTKLKVASVATGIDLTAFDDAGTIVETFGDGSTKTTTMEFDTDGNPVKITDSNGNVTTLTW